MIWTISSTVDITTYVDNCHPDAGEHGFAEALVNALQAAPHPDYGTDWADWLSDNAQGYLDDVSSSNANPHADTEQDRAADHALDLVKERGL